MQRKSDKSTILKVSNIHRQHKRYRTMTLTSHKEEREMTSNHFKSNTKHCGWVGNISILILIMGLENITPSYEISN